MHRKIPGLLQSISGHGKESGGIPASSCTLDSLDSSESLESLDSFAKIRVIDTVATSMPRSDWWACCTAVHYNKYLQIGTGGYNMLQLWIQQIAKVFLVGRKSNSTQIRSPWRPFEILSPDGVDPDSLKMLAKTTDKARCRGDNVVSSHCNFSQEFLDAMRCDMRHMWHALHSHEYGILAVLPNAFLKQVEVILQWIQRLITLLDCTWFIIPFVWQALVILWKWSRFVLAGWVCTTVSLLWPHLWLLEHIKSYPEG